MDGCMMVMDGKMDRQVDGWMDGQIDDGCVSNDKQVQIPFNIEGLCPGILKIACAGGLHLGLPPAPCSLSATFPGKATCLSSP